MDQFCRCATALFDAHHPAPASTDVSPLDAIWHIVNFLAPAVVVALFTAVGAKLAFSASLRAVAWRRLLRWALLPTVAVAIGGLIVTGRDGAMLTYTAMVVAAALGVWFASVLTRRA